MGLDGWLGGADDIREHPDMALYRSTRGVGSQAVAVHSVWGPGRLRALGAGLRFSAQFLMCDCRCVPGPNGPLADEHSREGVASLAAAHVEPGRWLPCAECAASLAGVASGVAAESRPAEVPERPQEK